MDAHWQAITYRVTLVEKALEAPAVNTPYTQDLVRPVSNLCRKINEANRLQCQDYQPWRDELIRNMALTIGRMMAHITATTHVNKVYREHITTNVECIARMANERIADDREQRRIRRSA